MKDYKDRVQEKADEIALEKYGVEYHELTDEVQESVYEEAIDETNNDLADLRDYLNDLERES